MCYVSYVLCIAADVHVTGGEEGVNVRLTREGRPSGEAYIEVETDADLKKALVMCYVMCYVMCCVMLCVV